MGDVLVFGKPENLRGTDNGPVDPPCECEDGHGLLTIDWSAHANRDKRPHVFFRVEDGHLTIKLCYPHEVDEDGEIIEVELTLRETASLIMAAARALAYDRH